MITPTNPSFKASAVAPVKQSHVIVTSKLRDPLTGVYTDGPISWTSADYLQSVNLDAIGSFLGTATKKATIKLQYLRGGVAVETPLNGDQFEVSLGLNPMPNDLSYPTVSYDYVSLGYFTVDEVSFNYEAGSVTITMYDQMWSAQSANSTDTDQTAALLFPCTIEELAEQVAAIMGVSFMSGFSAFPNASFIIDANPYSNISNANMQTVIQEIASATGTSARISGTTLEFIQYEVSSEVLDSDTLRKLKVGKKYGPVTSVIFGRIPQNDNIAITNQSADVSSISSINATTNLFTIVGHGLVDGSLVQVESTIDLPEPLESGKNYFVYTNGSVDTFALTPTLADGLAGTNIIDLTTAGSGSISLSNLKTQEVQINNNQIVYNDRQDTLLPVYEALVGTEWNECSSTTVGLGWFEVGDVIQYSQDSGVVKSFISEIHLVLKGSVKETLKSSVPDVATINYQTAGGILRTLYNTEIKVDKQNNEITSIVSQQDEYAESVQDNFTQVYQNIENILLTVQNSGGGNMILNSVGYATDSEEDDSGASYDKLSFWDYNIGYDQAIHGSVKSYSSSESQNFGGISGQVIEMVGASVLIKQRINVAVGTLVSLAMRVKNVIGTGSATISITNDADVDLPVILIDNAENYNWQEITPDPFAVTLPWIDITIEVTAATRFIFTDLRMAYGESNQGWTQAVNELLSTNVQFTKNGMKIFDNEHNTETQVTYNEFSTRRRSDGKILFEADDSGVVTQDLSVKGRVSYFDKDEVEVIRQITIPLSSPRAGIAYIRT